MVYDNTLGKPVFTGQPGYAIHDNGPDDKRIIADENHRYALYSDDGRGNGDYIGGSSDLYWVRRIAHSLDAFDATQFDLSGNMWKTVSR